ncbi:interleukin-34 isoform X1 [Centrocercus urophasianus]|uniref:interleukin-34 isoform X1 n=1 Tax=Centrocercus urophasianus TaxID=9002 RepID=UPI001C64C2BD|nr:interleukin-34 isoform X1 [Centrocercus urophasianus]XP_042690726.1 interleukin-34 isoform X1 [Centrocercus urophasianus]
MYQRCAAVLCVLAVLGLEVAAVGECELARLLQDKLRYERRLQYMKHNFPIDYTLRVQHEEVLRTANITRLRDKKVSEASLRYLWFHACSQAVLHILEVLPEKHPSRGYTQELSQLLDALGMEYSGYWQHPKLFAPIDDVAVPHPMSPQSDVDAEVADLVKQLHSGDSRLKAVRPKALLDNCIKVLRMLFGAHCRWDSA